ncbi:MAG: hypothetical protein ABIP55_07510 [Tepidisphaeraceae bacterium]
MRFHRNHLASLVSLILLSWGASDAAAHAATQEAIQPGRPFEGLSDAETGFHPPFAPLFEWTWHETLSVDSRAETASIVDAFGSSSDASPSAPSIDPAASEDTDSAVSDMVPAAGMAAAEKGRRTGPLTDVDAPRAGIDGDPRSSLATDEPKPLEPARAALTHPVAPRTREAPPAAERVSLVDARAPTTEPPDDAVEPWLRVAAVLTELTGPVESLTGDEHMGAAASVVDEWPAPAASPLKNPAPAQQPVGQVTAQVKVASHAERVLSDLAALRQPQLNDSAHAQEEPQQTASATPSDKVLALLEAACVPREVRGAYFAHPDLRSERVQAEPAVDILLDIDAPVRVQHVQRESTVDRRAEQPSCAASGPGVTLASPRRTALADHVLDRVRGGFDNGAGLRVSFGIERAVYINGSLVANSTLSVSVLGKLAGGDARAVVAADPTGLTLVQSGAGNVVATNIGAANLGTVIQNTLNDQNIRNVTVINAAVNSAQLARGLALHSTLRNVAIDALRR